MRHPAAAYIGPFAVFMLFLAADRHLPWGIEATYPVRAAVVTLLLAILSRGAVDWRFRSLGLSLALGAAVFAIWVGPDLLWPGYRDHWLFRNSIAGEVRNPLTPAAEANWLFLAVRTYGCAVMVPVMEELFWRGWLARWLIHSADFTRVPAGTYTAASFLTGTVLFGAEHGPYWEVGLASGALFNWWMARTRSLADCIAMHASANACLSAYVIAARQWQYW
jgi:CAAX prenyl protease-like protein